MKTDLKTIPGVGKNMAERLKAIGVTCVEDLVGKDPEELYLKDAARFPGQTLDRCCLYVYRLSVAWAEGRCVDPEKQKWWSWTDEKGGKAL